MKKSPFILKFDDKEEADFLSQLVEQTIGGLRGGVVFSILLFLGFAWLDIYIAPEEYPSMWVFRLIYCAYAVIILLYSYTIFFSSLQQIVMGSLVVVGTICLLGIILIPVELQSSNNYYAAFILLLFFNFTLTNLKFWYAAVLGLLIVFLYIFAAIFYLQVLKEGWFSAKGTLFISNCFFLFTSYFMGAVICAIIETYRRKDFLRKRELSVEKERSSDLLLNILPAAIAEKLKKSNQTIADEHHGVSILFADLVGFTQLAANYSPKDLVSMLDNIFSKFDFLAEKYQLEKIKTIGDAYMIAGGLSNENDRHPVSMAEMALAMQRELEKYNRKFKTDLKIRIGIHLGTVVAGVIGSKKFSYDMWGDAVNVASRMESSSKVGEIQVSTEFHHATKNHFRFIPQHNVKIKGKGEFSTYFLRG